MKRFWHYLKENENSETLQDCIFMDTETDEVKLSRTKRGYKLRFGWACAVHRNGRGEWSRPLWKRFTDLSDFWLWAMHHVKPKSKTWIWVHNSSFDYPVVDAFEHLIDLGWVLKGAIIDAPPTVVTYRCGNKTLVLADTLNIWRMSLRELGKMVELPKLEMPEQWGDQEVDNAYCIRDVDIIRKAVCEWSDFLRTNDLGGFCPTVAAQSMRTFRHRYLKDRILIENNDLSLGLARKCYHGGRVECGYIGELRQPVYSLDVNSMYPYVMSYAEMPLRLVGCSRWVNPHHLPKLLERFCLCAHVRVKTNVPAFPVIIDHKLCFPIGEFDAYLTTPEIVYALSIDAIVEIHLCASYEKGVPFKQFALDLYEYKERCVREGKLLEASHWKKLLNSFYGKWGQSGHHWIKIGACDKRLFDCIPDINAQTEKKTLIRHFAGVTFKRADDAESTESHPAIAAHICAEARMVLFALIRQLEAKDYFYCDTDGFLVSEKGFEAFRDRIDQYALGGLKHVKTYHHCLINGCKDLVLDRKKVLKGISSKAKSLGGGKYRQLRWHSLKGLLRDLSIDMPRTTVITKTLRRTYTKGLVGDDGFVTPLHLGDAK